MTGPTLGLLLAAVAAVAINAAYVLQHDALGTVEPIAAAGVRGTLRALLGSRRWIAAAVLGYGGLVAQIAAMALAPAWIVQSVLAAGLVVALAGWAWRGHRGHVAPQLVALILLAAGLTAIVASGFHASRPDAIPLLSLAVFAAVASTVACVLALGRGRLPAPAANACAAGLLYGVTTASLATTLAAAPDSALLAAGVLVPGGVCAVGGLLRFQRALQAGSPVTVVLIMSAAMNATAIAGGLLLAGGTAPGPVASAGLVALCAAGAVAAVPARRVPAVPQPQADPGVRAPTTA
jgi:hypothetical protein